MTVQFEHLLYGGDYNPDQWLKYPEILEKDIDMMKKAKINTVSLGIFAWAKLEPEDGIYDFDWMEKIMDHLYENGISVIMATPSGARPHWLADRYPEVLRMDESRRRAVFGARHNHCYTSKAYRKKVQELNRRLAERFDHHPAVILWHISNEYGGECHCPLCQQAFREWLEEKYQTIENLNEKWCTGFWSHDYQNFEQIESPSSIGEYSIHGLYLDWRRFVSYQTTDFCREEIKALRSGGAEKPATTNMMYDFYDVNYHELAEVLDIVSWDNYPLWHKKDDSIIAMDSGMQHDVMRTLKRKPYLLMESCPGATNWQSVSKLKRPGILEAASLQALAHGSESVLYFQIRKGRGGFEKFHGAVIDHYGKEDDRTYQECCQVGRDLQLLEEIKGSDVRAEVAVVHDWENRWAVENAAGPRNENLYYKETLEKSYWAFRKQGLNVDMIDMTQSLDRYKIVAAPMLYLMRADFQDRVRKFVSDGGIFVLTYWSGVVDENDLCCLGGTPGGLMDVMGLRSTEIDGLYDWESNALVPVVEGFAQKEYKCEHLCQLLELKEAKALMVYGKEFYKDTPVLTENAFGKGMAYYVGADAGQEFYDEFYRKLAEKAGVKRPMNQNIPEGIEVNTREKDGVMYLFLQNFKNEEIDFMPEYPGAEVIFGSITGMMKPYETIVLKVTLF